MNLQKSLIGAVTLMLACATIEGTASAASSWAQQPSWASSVGDAPVRRSPIKESNFNLSPFAPGTSNIALDVGQVFLMGDLSSNYPDNIGTQVHYTYGVSDMFGFDSSFGYSSHANDLGTGSLSMTTLLAGLRSNLTWYDKVIPHMIFGLGFYRPSYDLGKTSLSPILFGLHLGPGVDLELTKQLFFGAALTFHNIFGNTRTAPDGTKIDAGGTYTSFFLRAGFTF